MPGIDPEITVHRLNISPGAKPVKQRKRQFASKRHVVIQEEVGELVKARFIREVQYPDWLANVVLVKKASGKWRVCIDFTDLNKACPKDSYPPPGLTILWIAHPDISWKNIEAYVDDMVVKSIEQHISDLEEVFATLRKYWMKLNLKKCVFGVASGKFLSFMITHQEIEANPDKIQALATLESPRTKKKCEKVFSKLKQTLASPPILTKPEPGDTLLLYLAVSQNTISGILVKGINRAQQPIYYVSKVLLDAETRYTLADQLAFALIVAARKLRQYFQSHPIVVLTNQPLKHILQKPDVSGKLLKWAIEIGEFDIEFKPRPSIKAQALADFIAKLTPKPRRPEGSSSTTTDVWKIFVDGASNSSGSGAEVIITSPDMLMDIQCAFKFEFEATNNEAEYEAVIIATELVINLELENIKIFSDFQLVVGQIDETFEKKNEKMSLYCLKVHDLRRKLKRCEIVKITQADNCKENALSRLVFMGIDELDRIVHVRFVTEPSINTTVGVMDIDHELSWMDPIVDLTTNGNLLEDPRASRSVRSKAPRYCIINGVLFRRSLTLPYIRCLKHSESSQALEEVHEGVCGNHQGARALAFKLIRYEYYWPTMKKDAVEYVKECDKCQRFGNVIRSPAEDLTNISCSTLFEQWEIDILGPFQITRGQLKFVVVAVEYFTKWVEAKTLVTISEPKIRAFVWKSIICRFRIPKVLIIDNGRQFNNIQFKDFCSNLGVGHCLTSVSHPQNNGLAKDCNRGDPLQAALRIASYQDRIAKYFNKRVRPRRFRAGDLVLRKAEAAGHAPGKLGPVWERPFEVIRQLPGGAYSLRDTSGRPLPRSWNADKSILQVTPSTMF
ncbi:uncharacterized protein LOC111375040 [Olea europaea var. sylvestris]|uniref:uncharacterized protein LOC111375040 n=1 Tax=Olea europaea var. sylvestris TaxID=158386 RepID=UPI000C1D1E11|nr:uncharacterized protein LOC111375040 [Olea europaea var. sylvestris]